MVWNYSLEPILFSEPTFSLRWNNFGCNCKSWYCFCNYKSNHESCILICIYCSSFFIIPSASTKLKGGYTGITLSVCPQNRVHSVSSTILIGSISYLHILASNVRRCVACNAHFKIHKFEILANFFKFVTLTLSSFDLGSNMTQWYG